MPNSPEIFQERQQKLIELMANSTIDAIVLNPGPSIVYFTGLHFHQSERPVLFIIPKKSSPRIILPILEAAKVEELPFNCQVFTYGENPETWQNIFTQAFADIKYSIKALGIEPRYLRFLENDFLNRILPDAWILPADELIAELRMIKDTGEIQSMQTAVEIAQTALGATLSHIKPGVSEKYIASLLTANLLTSGSEPQLPFFPIVASGPNSANPHAAPTARKLQVGDLLIIDWGAAVNGYYSDLTRTFAIGKLDPELEKIARIVLEANQAGMRIAEPGIKAGAVDIAARSVIAEAGYGEFFTHRTGHGLGLDGHEPPYIRGDNDLALKSGMTFTIEPGIYLPGKGGVRIEDDVLITEDGVKCFSNLSRQLITIQ